MVEDNKPARESLNIQKTPIATTIYSRYHTYQISYMALVFAQRYYLAHQKEVRRAINCSKCYCTPTKGSQVLLHIGLKMCLYLLNIRGGAQDDH